MPASPESDWTIEPFDRNRTIGQASIAESLANKVGIRAVEVHALNNSARRFYEKYGFLPLLDDTQHLFLPMHVIRKLKLPPL